MLTFKSVTTVEFASEEDLEAFVRQMPWEPQKVMDLIDYREEIVDEDEVDFPGAGKTIHKFSVEGKEE
jgi:hypothetical protein